MSIDFTTINTTWATICVETLKHLGMTQSVVCPGSRSTPLTVALALHPDIDTIPILDERSAAYFALGLAKRSGKPIPIVCTSGTAGANMYPAVIEAHESGVPMVIITADRPPDMRECRSGQTIVQQHLYGHYPNWYLELALPTADWRQLAYLRQTLIQAWQRSCGPVPGPVHLNQPFQDPLAPVPDQVPQTLKSQFHYDEFFKAEVFQAIQSKQTVLQPLWLPWAKWCACVAGIIIAGPAQPQDPEAYCQAVYGLSAALGWPVLADGLSPVRHYAHVKAAVISTYDLLLQQPSLALRLRPTQVIQLGSLPTSKPLRTWLAAEATAPDMTWILDPGSQNLDPLHNHTVHLLTTIEEAIKAVDWPPVSSSSYWQTWVQADHKARSYLNQRLAEMPELFEGKVAWMAAQYLPKATPVMIANSMPIRDVENYWVSNAKQFKLYFNRGANGIEGMVSTSLGLAYQHQAVLLTGDLSLLHDTNGFLLRPQFKGHLTIILINNRGGGIFEMLPIAGYDPPFEDYFAMPQAVEFQQLCQTYQITYQWVQSWDQLALALTTLPAGGIRLLEIRTDRKQDAHKRQEIARAF